jgi:hypothetical protein
MKRFFAVLLIVGLVSCDNADTVEVDLDSAKKEADTLYNRVKESEVVDSIRSKGEKFIDSVKSKGGKLVDKAEDEIDELRKDTTR